MFSAERIVWITFLSVGNWDTIFIVDIHQYLRTPARGGSRIATSRCSVYLLTNLWMTCSIFSAMNSILSMSNRNRSNFHRIRSLTYDLIEHCVEHRLQRLYSFRCQSLVSRSTNRNSIIIVAMDSYYFGQCDSNRSCSTTNI